MQPSVDEARAPYKAFVDRYNWVRPHDSLGLEVPGSRYTQFPRKRPESVPKHHIPEGAISRGVDCNGFFGFKGRIYKIGRGLVKQRVVISEAELGLRLSFAGFPLPYLFEL